MITQDNFNQEYADPIEEQQIRHFVCIEMGRQIHRYIKAMHGSKQQMLRFEEHLKDLPLCEKEAAIARYIDLNRKAIKGLDMKIVLARAMANYSDTFDYLVTLVNDKRKMVRYLNLIREIYIQYHEVIERKGQQGPPEMNSRICIESAEGACSPWRSPATPSFIPVARQGFPSVKQPPGTHSP
ncbi:hypothetical protein [Prevotella denticola]|uniref:hypothetical protein n=1 Tax=Prevotella denticola TaxID=28129 RepID=UPI002151C436|nr:hypothetical protein [Prevotella denticola]